MVGVKAKMPAWHRAAHLAQARANDEAPTCESIAKVQAALLELIPSSPKREHTRPLSPRTRSLLRRAAAARGCVSPHKTRGLAPLSLCSDVGKPDDAALELNSLSPSPDALELDVLLPTSDDDHGSTCERPAASSAPATPAPRTPLPPRAMTATPGLSRPRGICGPPRGGAQQRWETPESCRPMTDTAKIALVKLEDEVDEVRLQLMKVRRRQWLRWPAGQGAPVGRPMSAPRKSTRPSARRRPRSAAKEHVAIDSKEIGGSDEPSTNEASLIDVVATGTHTRPTFEELPPYVDGDAPDLLEASRDSSSGTSDKSFMAHVARTAIAAEEESRGSSGSQSAVKASPVVAAADSLALHPQSRRARARSASPSASHKGDRSRIRKGSPSRQWRECETRVAAQDTAAAATLAPKKSPASSASSPVRPFEDRGTGDSDDDDLPQGPNAAMHKEQQRVVLVQISDPAHLDLSAWAPPRASSFTAAIARFHWHDDGALPRASFPGALEATLALSTPAIVAAAQKARPSAASNRSRLHAPRTPRGRSAF
eukprot:gnl/TRDRNA2_/TRDRNA2_188480_c0_seq1.p1 gnl/TRDRNA2_/TRDRNA2_188480_c0~~gnl/TRDRNA2_/TRDRNA2_188480_c0_seq1.p1  ORF type:complete len:541 (+),score=56.61 gnl/TRDRNA2_/TRDRNA2_188480_c0_seq1:74-1696(+)